MNSKVETYLRDQLAFTGFVIASAEIAYRLRAGDLWQTRIEAGFYFSEAIPKLRQFLEALPGVAILEVRLDGFPDWAIAASRSRLALSERIEQITGLRVQGVRPVSELKAAPVVKVDTGEDPIPTWACTERTERLAAAGIKDTLHPEPSRFGRPLHRL